MCHDLLLDPRRDLHHTIEFEKGFIIKGQRTLSELHVDVTLVEKSHRDMVAPVGAMAFIADVNGPVVIGDGKTARDSRCCIAGLGGQFHQIEEEDLSDEKLRRVKNEKSLLYKSHSEVYSEDLSFDNYSHEKLSSFEEIKNVLSTYFYQKIREGCSIR